MTVRTYDSLWKVDKRLYRIGDIILDRAPFYSQIAFFSVGLFLIICVLEVFGQLNWNYALVKFVGLPLVFAMFMTTVKFDGKRPDRFLMAIFRFYGSHHFWCRYHPVKKPMHYCYEGVLEWTAGTYQEERREGEKNDVSDAGSLL